MDSHHTHDHVRAELEAYAPLTSVGSYCVVFDTLIEDLPADRFPDRPWGPGHNPKTAVWDSLKTHPEFEMDQSIPHQYGLLLICELKSSIDRAGMYIFERKARFYARRHQRTANRPSVISPIKPSFSPAASAPGSAKKRW